MPFQRLAILALIGLLAVQEHCALASRLIVDPRLAQQDQLPSENPEAAAFPEGEEAESLNWDSADETFCLCGFSPDSNASVLRDRTEVNSCSSRGLLNTLQRLLI